MNNFSCILHILRKIKFRLHAKPSQRAGGYRIGFLQYLQYEKSRWLLNYSSMYISNE